MADKITRILVRLSGTAPLMFNRMSMETLLAIRSKVKKPKTAPPENPRDEAKLKLYYLNGDESKPILPREMLWANLVSAGQFIRLDGKRTMSTAKATVLPAFMMIEDAYSLIQPKDWEVDIRAGRNPNGGEAVCIVRPRFDQWTVEFHIQVFTEDIGEEKIRELFDKAGKMRGLGECNPLHKGTNGTYVVQCWEKIKGEPSKKVAELAAAAN